MFTNISTTGGSHATNQITQLFAAALIAGGTAVLTMKPKSLDASDLLAIQSGITSTIGSLKSSITNSNDRILAVGQQVGSLTGSLDSIDFTKLNKSAQALDGLGDGLKSSISNVLSAISALDLDVDLTPITNAIVTEHNQTVTKITSLLSRLQQDSGDSNDDIIKAITGVVTTAVQSSDLSSQTQDIIAGILKNQPKCDLTPLQQAISKVDAVVNEHNDNFDEFITALAG